ncbi:MAG: hypothetical protein J4F43_03400 [Dehalococcoidia bacterium]|nr:hypothetical protein [Dehalococcoidia bacterium]
MSYVYLEALAFGGSPPYDFEWSSPSGNLAFDDTTLYWVYVTPPEDVDSTTECTAQVVVTDENGAEARDEFVITVDPT